MIRFYDAAIETEPKGSAVLLKEPRLLGKVLFAIADTVHRNRRKLYACDANDEEHAENLGLAQVSGELDEESAAKLAAAYQPEREIRRTDPVTGEMVSLRMPACDLRQLLNGGTNGAIGGDLLRVESA